MITDSCHSSEELSQYALGTLDEDCALRLEAHLDLCPACVETIQQLESQTDSFTRILRNRQAVDGLEFLNEHAFRKSLESLSRIGGDLGGLRRADRHHLASVSRSPQPGDKLGQYTLLEVVGKGGMGLIYRARQEKLDKIVALKVLSAARVHDRQTEQRFQREMKAAGQIEHPNVVRAVDANVADGVHFLVMEFVDGVDLSAILKQRGPVSVEQACAMVRMAAIGLSQIHQAKMVHRDVKPGNLMLSRDGQVKILDLGLALLHPSHLPPNDDFTSTAQLTGTVDYMSPEQANNTHDVDFRTDIYGLGATLFALLTGRSPLGCRKQTLMKKLSVLANESAPSVLEIRSNIPKILAELISAMLNRDPLLRPKSAADVAIALEPFASEDGLLMLVDDCRRNASKDVFAAGTDSIQDTVVLSADAGSLPAILDPDLSELSTVVAPTSVWRATLWIGMAAFLAGTLWWLPRTDRPTNIADAPETLNESTGISLIELDNLSDNVAAAKSVLKNSGKIHGTQSDIDRSAIRGSDSGANYDHVETDSSHLVIAALNTIATDHAATPATSTLALPWHVFSSAVDPDARSLAINRAVEIVPVHLLLQQMLVEKNSSIRAGLLLAISEFEQAYVLNAVASPPGETRNSEALDLIDTLLHWYVNDLDSEVHSSVEFLLRHWGQQDMLRGLRSIIEQKLIPFDGGWYQPMHAPAMVVITAPRTEQLGSPKSEPGRFAIAEQDESLRTVTVPYSFAVSTTEITANQFWRAQPTFWNLNAPIDPEYPANNLYWHQAAEFCNQLSLLEGIPPAEHCYFSMESQGGTSWRQKPNALELIGYRLPTEDEWEIACRAGTSTARHFGNDLTFLSEFVVGRRPDGGPEQVGSRMPNAFGLFDTLGNVAEWVHMELDLPENDVGKRRARGGSAWTDTGGLRSAARYYYPSMRTSPKFGFRVARTIRREPTHGAIIKETADVRLLDIFVGPCGGKGEFGVPEDDEFTELVDNQVVSLGAWPACKAPPRLFRIRNRTSQTIRMTQLPWTEGVFVFDPEPKIELQAGESTEFGVRMPLNRAGQHEHDLNFEWKDFGTVQVQRIRVNGFISGPLVEVFPVGLFGTDPNPVRIGVVPLGSKPGIKLYLRNIGIEPVSVKLLDVSAPFQIASSSGGVLLPHRMDEFFRVTIEATQPGLTMGMIQLETIEETPNKIAIPIEVVVADSATRTSSPIGLFRSGTWLIDFNRDGNVDESISFGREGDQPLTGDWNGDGVCDLAVWRKTADENIQIVLKLRGDSSALQLKQTEFILEGSRIRPVSADRDGDGKTELGYVRPNDTATSLVWAFDTLHDGTFTDRQTLGVPGDDLVIGDWNGDGIDDLAVARPGEIVGQGGRLWQLKWAAIQSPRELIYLSPYDKPIAGDWDGDGDDDPGGWCPVPQSKSSFWQFETNGDSHSNCDLEGFGLDTDIPVVLRQRHPRVSQQ